VLSLIVAYRSFGRFRQALAIRMTSGSGYGQLSQTDSAASQQRNSSSMMWRVTRRKLILASTILIGGRSYARATLLWRWSYTGSGISATGIFTTASKPDRQGFYQVSHIAGTRNGVTISSLRPAGTAIPFNEPYAVDNLIRTTPPPLTEHGFGFMLADGTFANPFYKDGRTVEVVSDPVTAQISEAPVQLSASFEESWYQPPEAAGRRPRLEKPNTNSLIR
jgi:hypothetical protein